VCDYRRGMDWWMYLLTTCTHNSELHFTDHWHVQTSALSLLQPPLAVFWQRLLPREILHFPWLRRCPLVNTLHLKFQLHHSNSRLTAHLKLQNSTDWLSTECFFITTLHGPNRKHRSQQFLYCWWCIRCLAMDVFSGSTIPSFRRHGTLKWHDNTLPGNGSINTPRFALAIIRRVFIARC
jgi:hypothetical protein